MREYNEAQYDDNRVAFMDFLRMSLATFNPHTAPFSSPPCFEGWVSVQNSTERDKLPFSSWISWAIRHSRIDVPDCVWNVLAWSFDKEDLEMFNRYRKLAIELKPDVFADIFSTDKYPNYHQCAVQHSALARERLRWTESPYVFYSIAIGARWQEWDVLYPVALARIDNGRFADDARLLVGNMCHNAPLQYKIVAATEFAQKIKETDAYPYTSISASFIASLMRSDMDVEDKEQAVWYHLRDTENGYLRKVLAQITKWRSKGDYED
jgi:hypothetical protein